MKNFYEDLPIEYEKVYYIDAKETKTGIIFILLSLVLMLVVGIPLILYIDISRIDYEINQETIAIYLIFIVSLFAYIILHELVHGLFFKIYTKSKLTFGISWSCAFCGVPNLYVKKWPMVVTSLAPFVIFTAILLPMVFITPNPLIKLFTSILFAVHFGGCVGDLYISLLLMIKYRANDVLVNDTGAKQTIYIKKNL